MTVQYISLNMPKCDLSFIEIRHMGYPPQILCPALTIEADPPEALTLNDVVRLTNCSVEVAPAVMQTLFNHGLYSPLWSNPGDGGKTYYRTARAVEGYERSRIPVLDFFDRSQVLARFIESVERFNANHDSAYFVDQVYVVDHHPALKPSSGVDIAYVIRPRSPSPVIDWLIELQESVLEDELDPDEACADAYNATLEILGFDARNIVLHPYARLARMGLPLTLIYQAEIIYPNQCDPGN